MKLSPAELAQIDRNLRLIDREIWIVTAAASARRGGLVATWVSTASIDRERPVLVAGLAPNHFTTELVQESRAFAAHLLPPDQAALAWNFARDSGRKRDKLAGLAIDSGSTGAPLLVDCLARFECRVVARYDAGGRLFFWGDVVGTLHLPRGVPPLREHEFLASLNDEQRRILTVDRLADAAMSREMQQRWRDNSPW